MADGFTTFSTPEVIAGSYFSGGRPIAFLNETSNGRRMVIAGGAGGAGVALFIYEWNGSSWTPNLLSGAPFNTAPSISSNVGYYHVAGTTLFASNFSNLAVFRGINALSYTGNPRLNTNWTRLDINSKFNIAPNLGGVEGARGIWVDDVNTVNGYPVIYLANTIYHCIQKITANKLNPSAEIDFDTVIIAGQFGSSW